MPPGWGGGPRPPAQEALSELQRLLPQQIAAHILREEREQRKAWQTWLAREWGTRPGAVCRLLRDDAVTLPSRISRLAGEQRDADRPGDGRVVVGAFGPRQPQTCGHPNTGITYGESPYWHPR